MPKLTPEMAGKIAQVEDSGGWTPPEPGEYEAILTECTMEDGRNAPYFRWVWQLIDHEARVYDNTSLSPNALWSVKRAYSALGARDAAGILDLEIDTDELVGRHAFITIGHREYNGKTQLVLLDSRPVDEPQGQASTSGDVGF